METRTINAYIIGIGTPSMLINSRNQVFAKWSVQYYYDRIIIAKNTTTFITVYNKSSTMRHA